ncbi:MAG: A24 family peptidase [Lachnospiraceae bacterium]|nr:A24 family peptidase [Lachnospiraceae bacterium]
MGYISEILLLILCGAAAVYDIKTMKVPNFITFTGVAGGIAVSLLPGSPLSPGAAVLGMMMPVLLLLPLFLCSMMGAGDIKLFMAAGCFLGPYRVINVMILSILAAGIASMVRILRFGLLRERFTVFFNYLQSLRAGTGAVRYIDKDEIRGGEKWLLCFSVYIFAGAAAETILQAVIASN